MDVYVFTPQGFETGGIELLHQLCNELNSHKDIHAYIWFTNNGTISNTYAKYNNNFVITTKPPKGSVLIFPESWATLTNDTRFKDYQKVIYFESVDWYIHWIPKDQYLVFPKNTIFLSQSYYAFQFLQDNCIESIYITDYLNEDYMNADLNKERKRQVLYNPVKGLDVTNKIMELLPDEKFIPIENMTRNEIKNLMEESMLYIDFGNHPGKDRIPREAAMCGCCIITNRQGSAFYYEDVPILEKYKFENNQLSEIVNKIKYVLDNYNECKDNFEWYRNVISTEKSFFKVGVNDLVNKLKENE